MLFTVFIFGFSLAQVIIQRNVFSRDTKFWFGIAAVILSGIPLLFQFGIVLAELTRLPFSYWIKLQVHRLLISILGYHAPPRSFAMDYDNKFTTLSKNLHDSMMSLPQRIIKSGWTSSHARRPSHARWWINLIQHGLCTIPFYIFSLLKLLILVIIGCFVMFVILSLRYVVLVVDLLMIPLFLLVLRCSTKLLSVVSFSDAFSGMYHVRTVSLAVWLADEKDIESFYDSRGRKVISKWDYPHVPEEAMPLILEDLNLERMKLLKRLKESSRPRSPLEQGETSEQGRLNLDGLLDREENLRWEMLGRPDWNTLLDREESFRWKVLNGMELTKELFKLEKLKLELKRLEPREQLGRTEQTERPRTPEQLQQLRRIEQTEPLDTVEGPEQPLGPELLSRLQVKQKQQLEQLKQEEMQLKKQSLEDEREQHEELPGPICSIIFRATAEVTFFFAISLGVTITIYISVLQFSENGPVLVIASGLLLLLLTIVLTALRAWWTKKKKRHVLQRIEEDLQNEHDMEEGRLWLRFPPWRHPEQVKSLERFKLQEMQSLMVKEPNELRDKQLMVSKVIRKVRLQVIFYPRVSLYLHNCEKPMSYFITATESEERPPSKFYLEEFDGYCQPANAAEFLKLVEILDDNTFVVKRQAENPLFLQVDKFFNMRKRDLILPCESLRHIVESILEHGKKIDAIHVRGVSYV